MAFGLHFDRLARPLVCHCVTFSYKAIGKPDETTRLRATLILMRKPALIEVSFERASQLLVEHLRSQGMPDHLAWIFRGEVTGFGRRLFVHPSPSEINQDLARRWFDLGVKQGRGIRLMVLGFTESLTYCYVWLPADDLDASQSMTQGLHFTISVESYETGRARGVTRVRSVLLFRLRQLWYRLRGEPFSVKELPLRRNVVSARSTTENDLSPKS